MRKSINFFKKLSNILLILMFSFRSFTDAIYVSKGIESNFLINLKYIILLIGILIGILQLKTKKDKYVFKKEFISILIGIFIIFSISIFKSAITLNFYSITLEEIFKLIIPIIYAFIILNTFSFKEIYNSMCWILIISFLGYMLEIGTRNFTLSNILTINFSNSYSPFESSMSCGTSIAMCVFFMYYRKNKFFQYLSLIFTIFTFKRLSVLFAIVLLFSPYFININLSPNKKMKKTLKIFFIVATLIYYWLLLPSSAVLFEKVIGQSQQMFTMGRSEFLISLKNIGFISSGLGSSTIVLGRSLEMDLIKIFLETSIIGLIAFVFSYFECVGSCRYTYMYMVFEFFNMLTSHSLTNSFNWILTFLIIGCISYKQIEFYNTIGNKKMLN